MKKCIFCEFGRKPSLIPNQFLAESRNSFAMLSYEPPTKGHLLIVPKKHFDSLKDIPKNLVGVLFNEAIGYGEILKNKLGAKAYVIKVNNELFKLEANKGHIGHVHIHVIPRYKKGEKMENPKRVTDKTLRLVNLRLTGTKKSVTI